MAMTLFALNDSPENRIVKFTVSAEVQAELEVYFQQQMNDFNALSQERIPFDGKYKPDQGEVLVIENFDDINGLAAAIRTPLGIPDIAPTVDALERIKALFTGFMEDGQPVVLIQYFDKRKVISTNGLSLFHSADVYKKIEGVGLTIDSKLASILKAGNLTFFSFHLMRRIFDLSGYYREATDSDISDFAALPSIKVENLPQLIELSDSWVRRKLSLIQQSQILETVPINDIKAVAVEFNIQLNTVTENDIQLIVLPNTKVELKALLRFLDDDYYKSPLSEKRYLTNSKRIVVRTQ